MKVDQNEFRDMMANEYGPPVKDRNRERKDGDDRVKQDGKLRVSLGDLQVFKKWQRDSKKEGKRSVA